MVGDQGDRGGGAAPLKADAPPKADAPLKAGLRAAYESAADGWPGGSAQVYGRPASAWQCPVNSSACKVAEVCSTPICPLAAGRSSDSASSVLLWCARSTPSQAAAVTAPFEQI